MRRVYLTNSPGQTKKLGEGFAQSILKTTPSKKAVVFGLVGDLGGGKTTFLQGFARGLGIKEKVLSPTFVIIKKYQVSPKQNKFATGQASIKYQVFYHVDCYRVEDPKELLPLGFKEIISNSENIVAVEWAEKVRELLPGGTTILKFDFVSEQKRRIVIKTRI